MTETTESTPAPNGAALPAMFVHLFAGKRAVAAWLLFIAVGFAVLFAMGRGVTEGATTPHTPPSPPMFAAVPPGGEPATDLIDEREETEDMSKQLPAEARSLLESKSWTERVGDGLGIWVSVKEEKFRVLRGTAVVFETRCSTAAKGPGSKANSLQTPLGWHIIAEKFGDNAPWGQVFREKRATKEVWKRGEPVKEDLVLTRVLTLRGEEPGKNLGGGVDSFDRGIYIHGTNDEAGIGTPTSHGCIRLTNDDAITAYQIIPLNTPVLITEE